MHLRTGLSSALVCLLAATAACSSGGTSEDSDSSDLTSITARSRDLEFAGKVYVAKGSSQADITAAVQQQTQTAFGPMRTSDIAVNSRELKAVDPATFKSRDVKVIDTNAAHDAGTAMTEVSYTYKDNAVVAVKYAARSSAPLALMNPGYQSQGARIMTECTENDDEAKEFASQLWYVFEPSLASCGTAIKKEQDTIATDRKKLSSTEFVTKSEVDRLYVPITAKLGADKTNKGLSWPEYHRLYKGGVKSDALVVSLVYGVIDDTHPNGYSGDTNWAELMTNIGEIVDSSAGWHALPGDVDLTHFTLKSGKKVDNASISDLAKVHDRSDSLGLSETDAADLDDKLANALYLKWVTIERPIKVQVGTEAPRDFAEQLLVYFGSQNDGTPHHFALKNSDVFLYNGHSYIGYGPLDPSNFHAGDFPNSYQIFWVDGCVSYNYYEKDYIPLKQGGTKNLDLITNGIEAPTWHSGHAMAEFVVKLFGQASYHDLLVAAQDTDPLRVVDGELDNDYSPTKFPIKITAR